MQFWQQISIDFLIFIAPRKLLFSFISKSLRHRTDSSLLRVPEPKGGNSAGQSRKMAALKSTFRKSPSETQGQHSNSSFFIRRKYPFSSVAESTPANVARRSTTLYSCVIRFTISKKGNATGHFDACHHHFFDVLFAWKIVRAWNLSYNNLVLMVVNSTVTLAFYGYIW